MGLQLHSSPASYVLADGLVMRQDTALVCVQVLPDVLTHCSSDGTPKSQVTADRAMKTVPPPSSVLYVQATSQVRRILSVSFARLSSGVPMQPKLTALYMKLRFQVLPAGLQERPVSLLHRQCFYWLALQGYLCYPLPCLLSSSAHAEMFHCCPHLLYFQLLPCCRMHGHHVGPHSAVSSWPLHSSSHMCKIAPGLQPCDLKGELNLDNM